MTDKMKIQFQNWGAVFKVAWPLIIANSFWNLQMTIDRMFLGQYSTAALAASLAVASLFWTPMALLQQTAAYVTTFVAQFKGSGNHQEMGKSFWTSLYVSLIGGVLFLVLIPASEYLFQAMGHSEKLAKLEYSYFMTICYSALPMAVIAVISGFFTGLSQTRIIMVINGVGLVANVIFDYLFIFGNFGFPRLGIEGAGIATSLANVCGAAFGLIYLFSRKEIKSKYLNFGYKWDFDFLLRYLKYAIPSGLQWSLEGLSFAVFLVFVGQLPNGETALASSSIALTVLLLAALPAIGIGQAVSALVGEHLGQDKPEQAVKDTWAGFQMAFLYIVIVSLSFVAFPSFYISWFENDSNELLWQQTVAITPYILWFVAVFCPFDALNFIFGFALKGAGDTKFVFLVALLAPWPLMVLPAYLVREMDSGIYWSWFGVIAFVAAQGIIMLYRFLKGGWKSMRVTTG